MQDKVLLIKSCGGLEIWASLGRLGSFCAKPKYDFHIVSSAFVTETNVIQFLDWPPKKLDQHKTFWVL